MKKIIIGVVLVLALLIDTKKSLAFFGANVGVGTSGTVTGAPTSETLVCTDSDAKDIYSRGSVTYTYINISGAKATNTKYDECTGSGTQVHEGWCYEIRKEDGVVDVVNGDMVFSCEFGCINGACRRSAAENPTPLPTPTATPGKLTCVDSDNYLKSNDIYTRGKVSYTFLDKEGVKKSNTLYDECNGSGTQVNEMWCYKMTDGSEDFVPGRMIYNCPNGCVSGACRKTAVIVKKVTPVPTKKPTSALVKKEVVTAKKLNCSDSDVNKKGYAIYEKGSVTYMDQQGVTNVAYDECSGSKKQINEMYCYEKQYRSGNFVPGRKVYTCPKGCVDGACVIPPTIINSLKRLFGLR